jgi:hypothetical protein
MSQATATDTERRAEQARIAPSEQLVLDVLIAKRRHGVREVTAGEMREMLEQIHAPRRFDKGWVTGRLDPLLKKGLVAKTGDARLDPSTQRTSELWCIPEQQARLVA